MADGVQLFPGQRVHLADAVHLVAEKFHADGHAVGVGQVDLHNVAAHAELVADEVDVVALVLQLHQAPRQLVAAHLHPGADADDHAAVIDGIAQAVDTGHAGHDDHVPPLGQGGRGRVAQPVDLVVDGAVLFNIGVGGGDIGLRLIVIVVADEVFHRVLGKKFLKLRAQLGGQRLVVGQHQGGPVQLGDHVGHGKGLAAAGHAHQGLGAVAAQQAVHQFGNGLRLVAGGLIFRNQFESVQFQSSV